MTNKCEHKSFWEMYKIINFKKTFSVEKWIDFQCSTCNKKCNVKWRGYNEMNENSIKKYFIYFLWLFPAIILIILVAAGVICSLIAIWLITFFHFWAMYYIINSSRLEIRKKWFFNFG